MAKRQIYGPKKDVSIEVPRKPEEKKRCEWCGVEFSVYLDHYRRRDGNGFCSWACRWRAGRHRNMGYPPKRVEGG